MKGLGRMSKLVQVVEGIWGECWCASKGVLSPLIFAIEVDVVTEDAREGSYLLHDILYAEERKLEDLKERFQR